MKKTASLLLLSFLICNLAYVQAAKTFIYDDKGRRDPFMSLIDDQGRYLADVSAEYTSKDLRLSGVLWDPRGPSSALINNEIVTTGEYICGYKVKRISKDSVTVTRDGKEFILWLSPEQMRGEDE